MPDALASQLDVHNRLIEIARKAVHQVKDNPRPAESVLPGDLPLPPAADPPNYR